MPSLKSIRLRIASVKNTQKITKAMKLVAAARLRRAQQRITELRPYANKVTEVLSSLASRLGDADTGAAENAEDSGSHPLLARRETVKTAAVLVLSSDRGLAGAFNANVLRGADRRIAELKAQGIEKVELYTLGRKVRDYFARKGVKPLVDFTGSYDQVDKRGPEIARQIMDDFLTGKVDQVEVLFTEFKSAISQKVRIDQLLPVEVKQQDKEPGAVSSDYIYEPDRTALLGRLLPMYVETSVLRAILDSLASEHGARMTAMENATNNASTMVRSLTLQYNRARQAAITKELMEIIGGAEALKG